MAVSRLHQEVDNLRRRIQDLEQQLEDHHQTSKVPPSSPQSYPGHLPALLHLPLAAGPPPAARPRRHPPAGAPRRPRHCPATQGAPSLIEWCQVIRVYTLIVSFMPAISALSGNLGLQVSPPPPATEAQDKGRSGKYANLTRSEISLWDLFR